MSFRNQLELKVLGVLLLAMSASGCGTSGFDSQFVPSADTEALIKEAKNGYKDHPGVIDIVNERFGTPQKLNVWEKLPLQTGGIRGTVSQAPTIADDGVKSLPLSLDEALGEIPEEGIALQIITGEARTSVVTIKEWNAGEGIAEIEPKLAVAPAEGDQIIVAGGSLLQHGRGLYMRHCSHCHGTSGDGPCGKGCC